MKKPTLIMFLGGLALAGLLWVLTLGLHCTSEVQAYCRGQEAYGPPEIHVLLQPHSIKYGIPLVYTEQCEVLPYSLTLSVTVDDRIAGEAVVIESMAINYTEGTQALLIRPDHPQSGSFGTGEPDKSKAPGRIFRSAWITLPDAIVRQGNFRMVIKGHVHGEKDMPFEQELSMEYYAPEVHTCTGWQWWIWSVGG